MTDLITANPNLRGVFASNLIMAQGAGQAIAENKKADTIKLIGFDTDDKTDRLPQGRHDLRPGRAGPLPHGLRRHQDRARRLQGREGRGRSSTPAPTSITKANMDSEKEQELLNPKVEVIA